MNEKKNDTKKITIIMRKSKKLVKQTNKQKNQKLRNQ